MTSDFLPAFRSHLASWFEARLAGGRTPFRRVEECPPLLTGDGMAPDLVLWINRDSLLAGAMILIPQKAEPPLLQRAAVTAAMLGLNRFITWEAQAVNLWQTGDDGVTLHKSWQLPPAKKLTAAHFAIAGDSLLQELKLSAIAGRSAPAQLPAEHFANLCLVSLHTIQPFLDEAARTGGRGDCNDQVLSEQARAKGWLTLWRLLALLWHRQLPTGIAPERLEQALAYPLTDLPPLQADWLGIPAREVPLPAEAATRFHQLAGRLAQLRWEENRDRALATIALLLDEVTRRLEVDRAATGKESADLLVNCLPAGTLGGRAVVAPRPCLAGLVLLQELAGNPLPAILTDELFRLPQDWRPQRVAARLYGPLPPNQAQRRQWLALLRRAWPYRRVTLPGSTPAWVWEGLALAGVTSPEGSLQLNLPSDWTAAAGADPFWQMVGEVWALAELRREPDGRQTLELVAIERAPEQATLQTGDTSHPPRQLPSTEVPLALLARMEQPDPTPTVAAKLFRKPGREPLEERIDAVVFRDGVPRFPEDYLRRRDPVPLRSYQLPGPLHQDSSFFGYCRLLGPRGEILNIDNPPTAEALILVGGDGRPEVSLPSDPLIVAAILKAHQEALGRLWQALLRECRRQLPRQQQARAMARRIWRKRQLPSLEA